MTDIATIVDLIAANAARAADTPFLLFYDQTITYADLDRRTAMVAANLAARGVGKGDRVCFMIGNEPAFFDVLFGVQRLGAVPVPVSCWWQKPEVDFLIEDCQPALVVATDAFQDRAPGVHPSELLEPGHAPAADVSANDLAVVMYTSGTTGKPKGVALTHGGVITGARSKLSHVPVQPGQRALCVLPLFHSGGLNDLAIPTMYAGGTIVLREGFSATEFWPCIERYRVNAFYIVPTMWNILLRVPEGHEADTSSIVFGVSGAAPIPAAQLAECERRFGVPILEGYGQTETSGAITANRIDARKVGSVGTALDGVEIAIVNDDGEPLATGEIGEVVVRGPVLMHGYWNAPAATADVLSDGWLRTGDIGYLDGEGFLFLVDRKKELIIRGGVNVYPKEIETVIAGHPAVDSVAVLAEPHDKYGQVAKACVVVRRGRELTEDELRAHCADRLAEYKRPESIVFREALPTNALGKVVKKELVRQLAEEATSPTVDVAPLFEGMPARFLPEAAGDTDVQVSYQITGQGGGEWTITIRDRTLTLERGLVNEPRVLVIARDLDYHDITTGKLDGITAVMTGKLTLRGDMGFMAQLRQMFRPL